MSPQTAAARARRHLGAIASASRALSALLLTQREPARLFLLPEPAERASALWREINSQGAVLSSGLLKKAALEARPGVLPLREGDLRSSVTTIGPVEALSTLAIEAETFCRVLDDQAGFTASEIVARTDGLVVAVKQWASAGAELRRQVQEL